MTKCAVEASQLSKGMCEDTLYNGLFLHAGFAREEQLGVIGGPEIVMFDTLRTAYFPIHITNNIIIIKNSSKRAGSDKRNRYTINSKLKLSRVNLDPAVSRAHSPRVGDVATNYPCSNWMAHLKVKAFG